MRKKSPTTYTNKRLELDTKLADKLQEIGLISGIADLSRACGKNATYFACMRKRGYGLHIGSLAFLMARYSRELHQSDDVRERAKLRMALTAINEVTQEKCRLRELELFS